LNGSGLCVVQGQQASLEAEDGSQSLSAYAALTGQQGHVRLSEADQLTRLCRIHSLAGSG